MKMWTIEQDGMYWDGDEWMHSVAQVFVSKQDAKYYAEDTIFDDECYNFIPVEVEIKTPEKKTREPKDGDVFKSANTGKSFVMFSCGGNWKVFWQDGNNTYVDELVKRFFTDGDWVFLYNILDDLN